MKKILLLIFMYLFVINAFAQQITQLSKKQVHIKKRPSYGSCPNCATPFSNHDDVYHHSCLKTWIEQEFNTSLTWLNNDWNGEIDDIFKLPKLYRAIPISKSIDEYLKEILKENFISSKSASNELKLVTINKKEYVTNIIITNPNPEPLNHVVGVKITCIGSCGTGCQVDNTNGAYYCVKCADTNNPNLCKTNLKGDYGLNIFYETLFEGKNLFTIDETDDGEKIFIQEDIKNLIKENLPKKFVPIKSQIVATEKTKNLLLHCTNGKSAVILIGRVSDNFISNQFIIIQGSRIPLKATNMESYIKKSLKDLNKSNSNKQNYVAHVTFSCKSCRGSILEK